MNPTKLLLLSLCLVTVSSCQSIRLHPPAVPVVVNFPVQYVETFPAAQFVGTTPVVVPLAHTPTLGTTVRVTVKTADLFLDQAAVTKTTDPLRLSVDPGEIVAGNTTAVVIVEYQSAN